MLDTITMDFTVVYTLTIVVAILGAMIAMFYHAFSVGKDEETE